MIMVISPLLSKWGVLVMSACLPVRKVCSSVTGFRVLSTPREPERSIMPVATISCMLLPSTSSRRRPETSS